MGVINQMTRRPIFLQTHSQIPPTNCFHLVGELYVYVQRIYFDSTLSSNANRRLRRYSIYHDMLYPIFGLHATLVRKINRHLSKNPRNLHPGRLTWNLRIHPWKRKVIFRTIIFRFQLLIFGGVGCYPKPHEILEGIVTWVYP